MPATARIEAYLVRMLIRDFDELLIKGWQGIATVGLGRLVRCLGTGIGPSHDLGPQVQCRHHRRCLVVHRIAKEPVSIADSGRPRPKQVGKGTSGTGVGAVGRMVEDPGDAGHRSGED